MIQFRTEYAVTMHFTSLNNALQRWSTLPYAMQRYEKRARRTLPQNYVTLLRQRLYIHSLLSTTIQTGRSLESSQIQDCSSGKLHFTLQPQL